MVEHLHNLEHVHGDLREGNILIHQFENNDFDSGEVGLARYSHFMNHVGIQWPDGAEDGKLSSACLESLVTFEAQRSARGMSSNLPSIKDHSDKDYSINVNTSQLKAEPTSLEDKEVDEFLDSKYKEKVSEEIIQSIKETKLQEQDLSLVNQMKSEKMIPQSCDIKTMTNCHD
ncbi:3844_t:CDS:2 [Gigaspora margarita]|uniref:3844_t:CDS:1 n=1 Tax=Gigaspora margarita TaxID=4874 RepID=A0ABN7VTA4_GIGMA|nr:3844_t:CDS:2 [Gigaspora margarita]